MTNKSVTIVGGGLAGTEAALFLARRGVQVKLYEAKPLWRSAAHKSDGLAELVCSNSLKSDIDTTASGALKNELRIFGSRLIPIADGCRVPAGGALAVDRDAFSAAVTAEVKQEKNIEVISRVVDKLDFGGIVIVCAGPVCHDALAAELMRISGESSLSFYDAAAPIITAECIDTDRAFFGARYGKGGDDYLNCPMTKDEYLAFYDALVHAERAVDEIGGVFEGCMPVEVMAARGEDALRYGPLRPVGFRDAGKPYAVLQLRRENTESTLYNLVGFQTNLRFGEQKRVFSMIPALKNIEIVRYGVMHRNTFLNAPKTLGADLRLKAAPDIFVAGQLCGVEGYVESMATGLIAAAEAHRLLNGKDTSVPPPETIVGALLGYISADNEHFQPMNANFGILPPIGGKKADRKRAYYDRSAAAAAKWAETTLDGGA